MTKKKLKKYIFIELLFTLIFIGIFLCLLVFNQNNEKGQKFKNPASLKVGTIATWSGSLSNQIASKSIEEAHFAFYTNPVDMFQDLRTRKVDACILPSYRIKALKNDYPDLSILDQSLGMSQTSFIFSDKSNELRKQFNEFLEAKKADGTMEMLEEKWFSNPSNYANIPYDKAQLSGENGTIDVAIAADAIPYEYIRDGQIIGYEPEFLDLFCQEYGYNYKMQNMQFDAMLMGISTSKYDIGLSNVEYTEERAQKVNYGSFMREEPIVAIVNNGNPYSKGLIEDLKLSFSKTFIVGSRWKGLIHGLLITLLISGSSIIFGSIQGYFFFLWTKNYPGIFKRIIIFFSNIFLGLPIVVFIMITYYILFGKSRLSGVFISIIAFTFMFSIYVHDCLHASIKTVPPEQREAALALGYTEGQTLVHILIPQALDSFLPSYKNEIISLLKSTSIVGYIAVNDLTRQGDLIRATTYDAFFPLITVALVYLLLTWIIIYFIKLLLSYVNPKRRKPSQILKGIDTNSDPL